MFATAILLAALAAPPADPVDKGWELRIDAPRLAEPVLVGEDPKDVPVTVTLKNLTDRDRGYMPFPRSLQAWVLKAEIVQPDGKPLPGRYTCGGFPWPDDFKNLTPVPAGRSATHEATGHCIRLRKLQVSGRHMLRMTYSTADGTVTSNAIPFVVYNPELPPLPPAGPNPAVVVSGRPLPLLGREADRDPEERVRVSLDQIRVGDRTYLYYRRFVGRKWGGECESAVRLAELPGRVELVTAGGYGTPEPLRWGAFVVAYPHSPGGVTTLRVDEFGRVEERLVSEAEQHSGDGSDFVPFGDCPFTRAEDIPPPKLRAAYAGFVAAVKAGDVAKFCLPHAVELSDKEDPKRGDTAPGMNVPWMKQHFREKVLSCRRDGDDTFVIRTATSSLHWVQTRSGEWRIYRYADKPAE